ncbi:hypothetical protein L798_09714 [Zootermopsis nevadensis]|uniref:Uncharacterized protein n=1 Tax=Zootermopsis nevadensis TaxID=136037 RepID=A0A067R301_ZOONE|nr:hypothetical protein L798_09714 [Zootermopsis nevadensis]
MGTRLLSWRLKHNRGVMLTTHPNVLLSLRKSGIYTTLPLGAYMVYSRTALLFTNRWMDADVFGKTLVPTVALMSARASQGATDCKD